VFEPADYPLQGAGGIRDSGEKRKTIVTWSKTFCVVAGLLLLTGTAVADAQGAGNITSTTTGQNSNSGSESGGTGVKTGHGPLSQPIPPAVSTTNPGQNLQNSPQRPVYSPGPATTNPPQQPFGTR
jgi:hypothetical protein